MSQFSVGHPKVGGRIKGTPNKGSLHLKDALDEVGLDILGSLAKLMPSLTSEKKADVYLHLLQYIYPKRKPTDIASREQQPQSFIELIKLASERED